MKCLSFVLIGILLASGLVFAPLQSITANGANTVSPSVQTSSQMIQSGDYVTYNVTVNGDFGTRRYDFVNVSDSEVEVQITSTIWYFGSYTHSIDYTYENGQIIISDLTGQFTDANKIGYARMLTTYGLKNISIFSYWQPGPYSNALRTYYVPMGCSIFFKYYGNDTDGNYVVQTLAETNIGWLKQVGHPVDYQNATWTKYGTSPIVETGPPGAWDSLHVVANSVLSVNDVYHLYYTGSSDGQLWSIGHATSSDGIHWVKDQSNPIIVNAHEFLVIHENGLFKAWYTDSSIYPWPVQYVVSTDGSEWQQGWNGSVLSAGPSAWDSGTIRAGPVLHNSTGYSMWYSATSDGYTWSVGLAVSNDGINWTKYSGNPVLTYDPSIQWRSVRVFALSVLETPSGLVMWFFGSNIQVQRVGVATSTDGISWQLSAQPVLDVGPPGSWDSGSLSFSSVLQLGNSLWMWYSGTGTTYSYQIGLATANASILPSLDALFPLPNSTLIQTPANISVKLNLGSPPINITAVNITLDGALLNVTIINDTASGEVPANIANGQHDVTATMIAGSEVQTIEWSFNLAVYIAPDFVRHNTSMGYSIMVPENWTVQDNVDMSGIIINTLIIGPTRGGVETNVVLITGIDASILGTEAYLGQSVQIAVSALEQSGATNVVIFPAPRYLTISDNLAVIFGVNFTLLGRDMHEEAALIIDAAHSVYWIITGADSQQWSSLYDQTFDTMIDSLITNPLPSSPRNVTATPGNAQVVLSWAAPIDNGSGVLTNYNVYRSNAVGGPYSLIASPAGPSFTDDSLVNGHSYWYEVSAVNTIGEGVFTSPTSSVPFTVPGSPTGLVTVAGDMQITLNWTSPAFDGGRSIDYYIVYKDGVALPDHPTQATILITDLVNGQEYNFTVVAHNIAGNSSNSTSIMASPFTIPNTPTFNSTLVDSSQITLTWSPDGDGGSAIIGYKLYRSDSENGTYVLIATLSGLTFKDSNVTSGKTYWYQVSAVNAAGEGARGAPFSTSVPESPMIWILVAAVVAIGVAAVALSFVLQKRKGRN